MDKEGLLYLLLGKYLDEKKIKILNLMKEQGSVTGAEVSRKLNISSPLVTYHINGYVKPDTPGLVEMGLVDKDIDPKRQTMRGYKLSKLGEEILGKLKGE